MFKDFCNILTYERSKILDFLLENGDFNDIKNIYMECELYQETECRDYIKNILLGKYDEKNLSNENSFSSIYSLPTKEFSNIIINLINYFNIKYIEEFCSGYGLFGSYLNETIDNQKIKLIISDNLSDVSTSKQLPQIQTYKRSIDDLIIQQKRNKNLPDLGIFYSSYYK